MHCCVTTALVRVCTLPKSSHYSCNIVFCKALLTLLVLILVGFCSAGLHYISLSTNCVHVIYFWAYYQSDVLLVYLNSTTVHLGIVLYLVVM